MNLTKAVKTKARKLFKDNGYEKLYVNKKGEFFTSENLAKLSVKDPKKELQVITPADVTEPKKPSGNDGGGTGNGAGKGTDDGNENK